MGGRRFSFALGVGVALLAMTACAAPPSLHGEIAALESSLVMPDGADPLETYARFYTISPGVIEGEYVHNGMLRSILEHRVVHERIGENIFLVDAMNMPGVMDGGCSVLTLRYDRRTREPVRAVCNGMA